MMIGAGGAGKTSLRHGLMKKRLPKMAFSTLLANCLSVKCHWAGAGGSSGQNWVEIDDDDEINELATLLAEILDRKSLLQSVESASAVKDFQPFTEPQQQQLESIPMDHTEAVDKIRKKVFTKARLAKMHNQSQFEVLLNLWDSGGQLVFMNILPAFLTRRTLFMLVFNASKSLEEKLQVVTVHAGKIVNTVDYHLNTSELLMQWMASIDAHLSLRIDPYPRVMLIGTHLDQLVSKGCSPTVETERILNSLHSQYKDKTYADLLMPSPGYIVDNTTAGQEDKEDPAFKEIRKCIHEFATTNLAVRTPITWVFFRKVMQTICQPDKPVMNYSEVIAIAEACSIPPSTLPSVLNFYHELGVFMYYSKIRSLRDVIIVNPQWLINHTAKLLTPQGLEDRGRERYWNLLRTKGILTEILYKEILKHGVLSPQALVDMLEHFLLAVPIETTKIHPYKGKEYFVPCMLDADSVNTEVSLTHKVPQTQAKPMHIIFNTHYVPPGFYVRLLASVAEDSHCRILFEKINCYTVTFLYKEVDKIKLIEHTDSIEVQVTRASEGGSHVPPFSQTCQDALELMSASIQKVYTWLPGVSADSAFKCSSCSSDLPRHFVIFDQSTFTDTTVPCQKENLQQLGQCPLQQCWLKLRDESMSMIIKDQQEISDSQSRKRKLQSPETPSKASPGHQRPRMQQTPPLQPHLLQSHQSQHSPSQSNQPTLLELLRFYGQKRKINIPQEISTHSRVFGILLLEDSNGVRIRAIRECCRDDPVKMNMDILEEWVEGRGKQPVTWDTLVEVLRDTGLTNLASEIAAVKCSEL